MGPNIVNLFGVMLAIGMAGGITVATILIAKAFAARLEPKGMSPHLNDIGARLDELDGLRERVAELEERMEFSERVLSRPAEPRMES